MVMAQKRNYKAANTGLVSSAQTMALLLFRNLAYALFVVFLQSG